MYMGMYDRPKGHLQFELSPAFCEAVRQKIEDINLDGGTLEAAEDMHPHRRTFWCQGNERDIVTLENFVNKLTAN